MSNEEKILSMLSKIQDDIVEIKKRITMLEEDKIDDSAVERQLETLNKMRHLLTKEEADAIAAAIGEE